jgi:hypothetical protein
VVYNCDLSRIQLSPVSGANAYLVTVTVPADTLCNLSNSNANTPNNTTYNGLAFLINNPVTTKTTLFLMATAPDYRTLFFKGDQP